MTKSVEQQFRKLSEVDHVLKRPGRYIGSIKPHSCEEWLPAVDSISMSKKPVTYNPGFLKLFDEIISNSADHSKKAEGKHLDIIRVDVDQAKGEICVYDNGGIPVVKHKEYNQWVPEMIFELRAGTNFDDSEDSIATGQNGEGGSLTCIFSTKFRVETSDGKNRFLMTFTDNSQGGRNPKVEPAKDNKGFTRITYHPDFEKLGMTGIDDDNMAMLKARVVEIAATNTHLKVYWNGDRIMTRSFKDYIELFTGSDGEYAFDDTESFKIGIAKSEDGFQHTSFVNTTKTKIGGTHIHYIVNQIVEGLRTHIERKAKVSVKPADIRNHLHLFIDATIVNPRYSSQTKDELITEPSAYGRSWSCPDKFIQKLLKTSIIQSVLDWVEAKKLAEDMKALKSANKDLNKVDPRKVDKFTDASERHQRIKTVLFLSEGDCLHEDTKVRILSDDEFKDTEVKNVRPGDKVLTHTNSLKQVSNVSFSVKDSITIIYNGNSLVLSPDHRLMVYDITSNSFEWVAAKHISKVNHKLVQSTVIDAIHAPIEDLYEEDGKINITIRILGELEMWCATKTHKFFVFDVNTFKYDLVQVCDLKKDVHIFVFRDK